MLDTQDRFEDCFSALMNFPTKGHTLRLFTDLPEPGMSSVDLLSAASGFSRPSYISEDVTVRYQFLSLVCLLHAERAFSTFGRNKVLFFTCS
jgi:hypothetical protein